MSEIVSTNVARTNGDPIIAPTSQSIDMKVSDPIRDLLSQPQGLPTSHSSEAEEAPQVQEQEGGESPVPASRRLAELARRERMRLEQENKFKSERETWETNRKQYDPVLDAVKAFKENPQDVDAAFKLLEATGISYEDLTDRIIMQPREEVKAPELSVEELVERKLEERMAARDAKARETETERVLAEFKSSIEQTALSEASKYRFIAGTEGATEQVYDLIVEYWKTYQQVLPVETALSEVNSQLKEEYDSLRKRYEDVSEPEATSSLEKALVTESREITTPPRTLANKGNVELPKEVGNLSKDELLRRMIKSLG